MTVIKLRYVDKFADRTGKTRYYFRQKPGPRIPLPGEPYSAEFRKAYELALASAEVPAKPQKLEHEKGTFNWLLEKYFGSMTFATLAKSTKYSSRLAMERYIREEDLGRRKFVDVRLEHVERMMAKRASKPGAGNDLLKKLRALYKFAIKHGWVHADPTANATRFKEGEFHTWTESEIAQYEARWPIGTRERTAFALLLYTSQRMADVSEMLWSDIDDGQAINVIQNKTKTELWVPFHKALKEILDALPRTHPAILATNFEKPFTHQGFGNWMAERIRMAGLPERCVTHGIRKAAARRLAEAGCPTKQIMAITGHKTSKMVDHYTKAAEQGKMALAAINQLEKPSV